MLILPAFPEVAPLHFQMYYKWTNVVYLTLSNLVGLPSTVCPVGLNEDGLPFGVQVCKQPEDTIHTEWPV